MPLCESSLSWLRDAAKPQLMKTSTGSDLWKEHLQVNRFTLNRPIGPRNLEPGITSQVYSTPFITMDFDDDAPPELVDTTTGDAAEEITVKVPITIVTGNVNINSTHLVSNILTLFRLFGSG